MKKIMFVVVVFAILGLLGPLLGLIVLPLSRAGGAISTVIYAFFYDLVALLWLMWGVAAMEVNVGSVMAGVWAITANIVLFGIFGSVIAIILKLIGRTIVVYIACIFLYALAIWWSTGFDIAHTNAYAVTIAFLLYIIPGYVIARCRGKEG